MTSSLVGSEMCIRDRNNTIPFLPYLTYLPLTLNSIKGKKGATAKKTSPVSYTHLTLPTICSV
eukprot:8265438-Prorocentrum_lima.AAC.1